MTNFDIDNIDIDFCLMFRTLKGLGHEKKWWSNIDNSPTFFRYTPRTHLRTCATIRVNRGLFFQKRFKTAANHSHAAVSTVLFVAKCHPPSTFLSDECFTPRIHLCL